MGKTSTARYVLTQEQLDEIVVLAGQEGARAYRDEARKAEKRLAKQADKVEITKRRLRDYRAVKKKTEGEPFSEEELEELRFEYLEDLMGQSRGLESRAEKKRDAELWAYIMNMDSIRKIDRAYGQYRDECEKWGTDEARRRCRELYMLYMDETIYTAGEIAEMENIGERSVYRDVAIAAEKLSAYLFGF